MDCTISSPKLVSAAQVYWNYASAIKMPYLANTIDGVFTSVLILELSNVHLLSLSGGAIWIFMTAVNYCRLAPLLFHKHIIMLVHPAEG